MTLEDKIRAALEALGVYQPAFDDEIHEYCVLKREHSRTLKAWKATAPDPKLPPSPTDELYAVIERQRRDLLAHRDALGLTPKALKRLQRSAAPEAIEPAVSSPALSSALAELRRQAAAGVSGPDTDAP